MTMAITVHNATKSFYNKLVLNKLSLEIPKGEIFGLLGPSGCGKTTLIKLIIGMLKRDEGDITVLNYNIPDQRLLPNIGYMAQSDALYTDLTGEQNLDFFARLYKLPKKERKARIQYVAGVVELEDVLQKRIAEYSGGMMRRLSLAIALIHDPEVLILDEPTVGIDPVLKRSIWRELERLKKEDGKTIVITTHVMDEAERCDQTALLRNGHIIAAGSPDKLKEKYEATRFEEVFLRAGGEH
ncbi:ABC transporter ATP-binding protein [Virgibacillus halodenitrificans]|uniref:ABC transporter ATP-binding protein n=1 Tax=Virgibacillus halodenitrificans TaxID=1482 RepID=UPI002DBE22AF|nr:ABC transporter ATP-binding protein [Virgibacillus halodenitrificans]MEC2160777.1 ABC transporter ATP-binding protein [Virgibacillus halodenitrificans]